MTSTAVSTAGSKEQFFRYFQLEVKGAPFLDFKIIQLMSLALSEQIDKLATLPAFGGERVDAIDHCLAGIAHLHKEVQNASSYIPAYDQKIYAEVCFLCYG